MEDKVSVNVREIENGFLVDRSWCEKREGKGGCNYDYKNETYYLASLPTVLAKMFSKKKNAEDFGGKKPDGKDEFEEALEQMDKSKGSESDDMDEETEEEE